MGEIAAKRSRLDYRRNGVWITGVGNFLDTAGDRKDLRLPAERLNSARGNCGPKNGVRREVWTFASAIAPHAFSMCRINCASLEGYLHQPLF